jgi:predicted phosphodiesterase
MKILILGDVHGEWGELNIVVARALRRHPDITALVQVGDFSYAWPGRQPFVWLKKYWDNADFDCVQAIPFYFLDGNHENHDQLDLDHGAFQSNMIYMPRGSINTFHTGDGLAPARRAMFFGGATTPAFDMHNRIQGVSYWPQESIKYRQVEEALRAEGPIDIMFTHDHPSSFPYRKYDNAYGKADQDFLEVLRKHFKQKFHVFGHHHDFKQGETDGTQWACAPVINSKEAILWDGDSLQHISLK